VEKYPIWLFEGGKPRYRRLREPNRGTRRSCICKVSREINESGWGAKRGMRRESTARDRRLLETWDDAFVPGGLFHIVATLPNMFHAIDRDWKEGSRNVDGAPSKPPPEPPHPQLSRVS